MPVVYEHQTLNFNCSHTNATCTQHLETNVTLETAAAADSMHHLLVVYLVLKMAYTPLVCRKNTHSHHNSRHIVFCCFYMQIKSSNHMHHKLHAYTPHVAQFIPLHSNNSQLIITDCILQVSSIYSFIRQTIIHTAQTSIHNRIHHTYTTTQSQREHTLCAHAYHTTHIQYQIYTTTSPITTTHYHHTINQCCP